MTPRYAVCRVGQAQHPAKTSPDSDPQTPVIVMSQNPPIVIADPDPRSPICALLCELKMAGFLGRQEWEIPVQDRDDVEIYGMSG